MKKAILFAILAALFYSISIPFSKLFIGEIPSTMLAGLLYLGAGFGMMVVYGINIAKKIPLESESLNKKDIPYVILMIILDIVAPILLMSAISISNPSNISLINNFEIVTTSLIALLFFKEKISFKLWIGIILVIISSIILSFDFTSKLNLNIGSLLAILACISWGLENNCTRQISNKNPFQIVILKGIFSGIGALLVSLFLKEKINSFVYLLYALILGFISYGLSVFLYVKAQKNLGAAKTSAFYSIAPFLGVTLSMIITKQIPDYNFFIALIVMIIAIAFVIKDKLNSNNDK